MTKTNSINYADKCEFSLIVDDVVSQIPINCTSFTLYDSIYEFYPKASLSIQDTSGLNNEYMAFVNGTKVEIDYGVNQETWQKCIYRVVQNSMPELNNASTWGGNLNLSLIHDYFRSQTKKSRAFDSNISDIIKSIIKDYNFSSIDIDTTLNSGIWYQPYITDADFIMNRLLPFAYSTSSENTPFYCFIDSNNGFHLKNYRSITRQNPKLNYYFKSKGLLSGATKDTILSLSYAQVPLSEMQQFYNRILYSYDSKGNYIKNDENSRIINYPNSDVNPIPIKINSSAITSLSSLYDNDIKSDETENNNKGLETNQVQRAIVSDKLILTVPFNRDICAGDLVNINLPSPSEEPALGESSLRFSGDYIVEATYQKWDGQNSITILVCSKQTVKVTNDYRNVALILNRD